MPAILSGAGNAPYWGLGCVAVLGFDAGDFFGCRQRTLLAVWGALPFWVLMPVILSGAGNAPYRGCGVRCYSAL
jgi:hypothetical protein